MVREVLRYVAISTGFGLVWASMQYANGQVRDLAALAGPVVVFALAGVVTWTARRAYKAMRKR